jgi:hypothetical protein
MERTGFRPQAMDFRREITGQRSEDVRMQGSKGVRNEKQKLSKAKSLLLLTE